MPTPQLPGDYLAQLAALETSMLRVLQKLDPDAMPIDEVIDMFFVFAELVQIVRRADASADA